MNYTYNEDKMMDGIRAFREEVKNAPKPRRKSKYEMLPATMKEIARSVGRHFSIDMVDLLSDSREKNFVIARWVVTYLARQHNYSYPEIGRFLGRHHSTAMHSHRQAIESYEHNPAFREAVDAITKQAA